MIKESEKYAEHDKKVKDRLDANSQFVNYLSSMRNSIESGSVLLQKLERNDVSSIEDALSDAQSWLDSNEDASAEDIQSHLKDAQRICDPIIAKVYGQQKSQQDDDEEVNDEL